MNVIKKRVIAESNQVQELIDTVKSAVKEYKSSEYALGNGNKAVKVIATVGFNDSMSEEAQSLVMKYIEDKGIAKIHHGKFARGSYTTICNAFNIDTSAIEQDYKTELMKDNPKYENDSTIARLDDKHVVAEIAINYRGMYFGFVCSDEPISDGDAAIIL